MVQFDIHKLTIQYGNGGGTMYQTLWFREEVAGLPGDPRATLANDFVGTVILPTANGWRATQLNITGVSHVRVQRYAPYDEGVFTLIPTGTTTGTRTATPLPNICAQCVTILSERGGRRGRGRWYLGPASAIDQSDGMWTNTQQLQLSNMMATINGRYGLAGGYTVSGFRIGVWSKVIGGSPPGTFQLGFSPMTGWVVRPEVRGINRRSRVNV